MDVGAKILSLLKTGRYISPTLRDLGQSSGLSVSQKWLDAKNGFLDHDGSREFRSLFVSLQSDSQRRFLSRNENHTTQKALTRRLGIYLSRSYARWHSLWIAFAFDRRLSCSHPQSCLLRRRPFQPLRSTKKYVDSSILVDLGIGQTWNVVHSKPFASSSVIFLSQSLHRWSNRGTHSFRSSPFAHEHVSIHPNPSRTFCFRIRKLKAIKLATVEKKSIDVSKLDVSERQIPYDMEVALIPAIQGGMFPGLYLSTSPGRLIRSVRQMKTGLEEFIGPLEQQHLDIRCPDGSKKALSNKIDYSHEEIHTKNMLSILAALTPFSEFNQSPRNMYQCQMAKQTMGIPFHDFEFRTENKSFRFSPFFCLFHSALDCIRLKARSVEHSVIWNTTWMNILRE